MKRKFFLKKIQKGCPGYLRFRKIQTGTAMVSGYMLVLLLFFTGLFAFADRRNLFTVGAILAVLPAAKMTVHFLMYPKRGQAKEEEFEELSHMAGNLALMADLLITPEKKNVELIYTAVAGANIIIYCTDKKLDAAYHGNFIRSFLKGSDITAEVKFYGDLDKFKKRLEALRINEPEGGDKEQERIDSIVYNLKIMSI